MRRTMPILMAACLLAGCGTEVGRVPLTGPGSAESTATVKAGEVNFWTDLDVKWEGDLAAQYDLSMTIGDKTQTATCFPFDVTTKVKSVITNFNDKHDWSYQGKMKCSLIAPADGVATIKVSLVTSKGQPTFKKADLIIKQ